jgi:DNA-directed RNA polymerase subunit RPC12/RpoP
MKFTRLITVDNMDKTTQNAPTVGIVCPACGTEVNFTEIIEKKGSVKCVNCSK